MDENYVRLILEFAATYCKDCQKNCPITVISEHIRKVSVEEFMYQLDNDCLPTEVENSFKDLVFSDGMCQ